MTEQPVPDPIVFGPAPAVHTDQDRLTRLVALGYTRDHALELVAAGTPVIVRAVQTCPACPSQWDAWDDQGRYWYLRYRFGGGTAQMQAAEDDDNWQLRPPEFWFSYGDPLDGCIDLAEFAAQAGLELALDKEEET